MAIQITEYSYSSVNGEFVEFTNTGTTAVDMTGYSFDDVSRIAGSFSLSAFGTVKAGESVIITETVDVNAFRTAWGLPATVKVIGGSNLQQTTGDGQGLGRADEINLYDSNKVLVDRLTYDDATITGSPRTQNVSASTTPANLGKNDPTKWTLSAVGDAQGSKTSVTGGDIGNPGSYLTAAAPVTLAGIDLSKYTRIGRYDLPEPTRTTPPTGSLLAQEVSGVTYNWDTDTLFVVGDGGTSIVQVSKTGQLIDSMTLGADASKPQGTYIYDPEGIAYLGNGQFAITEERDRQIDKFTYKAGATITAADLASGNLQIVKLGTTIGNIGLEGVTYDPSTNSATTGTGFVVVKEKTPEGIFQTNIKFAQGTTGTATNGSPTTTDSVNLFDPALLGVTDIADVYALSNVTALNGTADSNHLIVLSQESGKIVNVDRTGKIFSTLTITADATDKISVADQSHEGVTVDKNGILYVVSENGGGDIDHPQLWVYAPTAITTPAVNQAPTAVVFGSPVTSIADKTSTTARVKVADIAVTDDGLGTNNLTLTGTDAAAFEIFSNGLYVKAGTAIDFKTKASYSVTVNVDDPTVGANPDATKAFTLAVTDPNAPVNKPGSLFISEVAPWASGNTGYGADWFEVTNTGTTAVDITGWKIDDSSNAFSTAVALRGVTSIAAGKSVVFLEGLADGTTDATIDTAFATAIFGTATLPTGFLVGHYGGAGVGLSTAGDEVNLFNAAGDRITGIGFGVSTTGLSFDNKAGLGSSGTTAAPLVTTLSAVGVNGAFLAKDGVETISVGTIGTVAAPGNKAPTDVLLTNLVDRLAENANTTARFKVADIAVTDDGLGTNTLSVAGVDASTFEVFNNALYIKAGTTFSYKTKNSYSVSVNVDDTTVGATPDATKTFILSLTEVVAPPAPVVPTVVSGTAGDDTNIIPTSLQTIFTDGGNDLVDASVSKGDNRIYGGDGNDELLAGLRDRLFGEGGDDTLDATAGKGGNRLYGGAGNDSLYAGTNDFLSGGDGDDKLFAGKGGNTLFGGAGADKFYLTSGGLPTSTNTVGDFEVGIDKLLILGVSGVADFSKVTLTAKGADTLVAAGGKDLAILTGIQSSTLNAGSFAFV